MWRPGEAIVRREVVRGRCWLGSMVIVVADDPAVLTPYARESWDVV